MSDDYFTNDNVEGAIAEAYDPHSPAYSDNHSLSDPSDSDPPRARRQHKLPPKKPQTKGTRKVRKALNLQPSPLVLPLPPIPAPIALAGQAGLINNLRHQLRTAQDTNADYQRRFNHQEESVLRLEAELANSKGKHSQAVKEVTSLTLAHRRLEVTVRELEKQKAQFQGLYLQFKQQFDQAWSAGYAQGYQKATEEVTLRSYHKGIEQARIDQRERNAFFKARREANNSKPTKASQE